MRKSGQMNYGHMKTLKKLLVMQRLFCFASQPTIQKTKPKKCKNPKRNF